MATQPQRARKAGRTDQANKGSLDPKARIDPYFKWAMATDFAYLGGPEHPWHPVLLELHNVSVAQFAKKISDSVSMDEVRVAWIYQSPPRDIDPQKLSYCTALVSRNTLVNLLGNPKKPLAFISRFELGSPVVPVFEASPIKPLPGLPLNRPKRAIVAVIDDGLAFAHERFRDSSGATRFKYFWNQDDTTGINPPPGFGWGRELVENQINTLLAACTFSGAVDEDQLYRLAGQNLAARRAKHGTHVMDLACGLAPAAVTATSPYLIGVQLPHWVTTETSGGLLTPAVFDALQYILNRADQIAAQDHTAPLPVVVNLSYGTIAGPHDGTALLEAAIDQLIAARPTPLRVVLPAGNHYLARCHERFRMAAAASAPARIETLQWRVQPDDQSASFVEIWLPHAAASQPPPQIAVRVTTPTGLTSPWIGPGGVWTWSTSAQVWFFAEYFVFPPPSRPMILLAMAPTTEAITVPRTAPPGTWRVEVKNAGPAITVDAWVQRGDTPFGYPLKGRQSRFDDPRYVRFDLAGRLEERDIGPSPIRRRRTVNALATGHQAIVIGAFRRRDYQADYYSGAGPIIIPPGQPVWRTGPDATAVGVDSVALHGVLAAGTRSGSVFAMGGTSVAAPQITRLIAEWMTAGLANDRAAVALYAASHDPDPAHPLQPAPERGGAGRIERVALEPPPPVMRWIRYP